MYAFEIIEVADSQLKNYFETRSFLSYYCKTFELSMCYSNIRNSLFIYAKLLDL